ncbi:MAG TPA: type II toxin-antitoxin system VapC family toxin, partial [Conexibacter sp.]|nr:type II toxin-antitoxin system VapC family toxin [Conexibacter sp.]
MTLYLDTSALVKLLVAEEGSEAVRASAADAPAIATSRVTYVEIHSAFARMVAGGRLTRRVQQRQLDAFHTLWQPTHAGSAQTDRATRKSQPAVDRCVRGSPLDRRRNPGVAGA